MYKQGEFTNYVEFVKTSCEQGMCTKEEASLAILKKAVEMLSNLNKELSQEQFMREKNLLALVN
jgi:hypothetical protein